MHSCRKHLILGCCAAVFLIGVARAQDAEETPSVAPTTWSKNTVQKFAIIPIQDGGRIKPLDTFAGFQLLAINGRRRCDNLEGESLTAMEWLLDCLFYPEHARQYKTFLIENADVLAMLSLPSGKERDRYSYEDLAPARMNLFQFARQFSQLPDTTRSPAQSQLINLAHNMHQFELLTEYLHFARHSFSVGDSASLKKIYGESNPLTLSAVLAKAPELQGEYMRLNAAASREDDEAAKGEMTAIEGLLGQISQAVGSASALAIIPPPPNSGPAEWFSVASLTESVFATTTPLTAQIEVLAAFERLNRNLGDPQAVAEQAALLNTDIIELAKARGEFSKVPMELTFYKAKFFYYSLILYILSFLLVAVLWLRPRSRTLNIVVPLAVVLPTLLLVAGITMRCIIRDRPPVTTLYETILFITAVAVVVALVIELIYRQRIALSLASFLGALGVFLANKYEVIEGGDTMPSMVAVLDTNFWLSTHVTTVTMGYAAGLLASAIAHVYILAYALGLRRGDPAFYRSLTRMTYGVLCFGLLFATLGTVLGGIWANYSWGRFWGWDPKENGALMIVLWLLIVLHARVAGYIREFGIILGAVCCGMIVAFSWFGVNLLGVGLHSYGFTSGIAKALMTFYAVEVGMLVIAAIAWVVRPVPAETATNGATDKVKRGALRRVTQE